MRVCTRCLYETRAQVLRCPRCCAIGTLKAYADMRRDEGIAEHHRLMLVGGDEPVEEEEEDEEEDEDFEGSSEDDDDNDPDNQSPVALTKIKCDPKVKRLKTHIGPLDKLLGGGFARGCVYVLVGAPGSGKSTLVMQIIDSDDVELGYYVSNEESGDKIKSRAQRLNVAASKVRCWPKKIRDLDKAFDVDFTPDITVIDSGQGMKVDGVKDRNEKIVQVMNQSARFAAENESVVVVISRVNKDGQSSGTTDLEHLGDGTIFFKYLGGTGDADTDSEDPRRLVRMQKHRHGPAPKQIEAEMTETGLVFFEKKRETAQRQRPPRI